MMLTVLADTFSVCQLKPGDKIPSWVDLKSFWSLTKTGEEFSIVARQANIPDDVKSEKDWKVLKVQGPLDFGLTGVLASIANPLAAEKISIFALSTFDTDYILVRQDRLEAAKSALERAGFTFR